MIAVECCSTDSDYAFARKITKDYIKWLDMDLAFQNIDKETADFPSMYGRPDGIFLTAWSENKLAGGAGLRKLESSVCEMKRLFVHDQFRGRGAGCRLCAKLIREAQKMGYKKMRLDTLGRMIAAVNLYRSFGFKEIESYRFNPDPTAIFMELDLKQNCRAGERYKQFP